MVQNYLFQIDTSHERKYQRLWPSDQLEIKVGPVLAGFSHLNNNIQGLPLSRLLRNGRIVRGLGNVGVPYGSRTPPRGGHRRERETIHCNSRELSGMDSTLPHLKDSRERFLDS